MKSRLLLGVLTLLMVLSGGARQFNRPPSHHIDFGAIDTEGVAESAIAYTRILFLWGDIQPAYGVFDESVLEKIDKTIDAELLQHRMVVGLLETTATWASDGKWWFSVPNGLYLPHNDPQNLWAMFVKAMVERYKDRIKHWVMWNEPDITDPKNALYMWSGSQRDYFQLLKVGYLSAKEIDPESYVHMASLSHWWDNDYFEKLLDVIIVDPKAADNNYYFDAASLNLFGPIKFFYDVPQWWYGHMRERGIDKPVWIFEANVADVSDEEQASWLIQASALAIAGGVEAFTIYNWSHEANIPWESYGIAGKPAAIALRTAARYFAGDIVSSAFIEEGIFYKVEIEKEQEKIIVLWNMIGQDSVYYLFIGWDNVSSASVFNKYGEEQRIIPFGAGFFLLLGGATAKDPNNPGSFIIGGEPLIVVVPK